MAISSSRSNITGGRSLGFQELATLIPQNSSPGLYNYVSYGISQGYSKSQLLSATNYFNYLQSNGFTTFLYSGSYYALRTFTSSTSWSNSIFTGANADVLIIAGGGGGQSGGGGAGEMYEGTMSIPLSTTVVVGSGGAGQSGSNAANGAKGNSSSFNLISCNGGGGAGHYVSGATEGTAGGSGGGSSINWVGAEAGSVKTAGGYGYPGAIATTNGSNGGPGGGGAGARPINTFATSPGGNGGVGRISTITGSSVYYAGGGGGGTNPIGTPGSGGLGGGGNGSHQTTGGNGTANTGGGGGGRYYSTVESAGSGGSGVVIVRFLLTVPSSFGA
jgi:hypothetical protein